MMHRIREAMKDDSTLLSGIVEMDETDIRWETSQEKQKDDAR